MDSIFDPHRVTRVLAVVLVGLEAVVAGVAAALYLVLAIVGNDAERGLSFGLAALLGLAAAGLGFVAKGIATGRRWATSPAVTWQVLQGFVGAYAISIGQAVPGAIALGSALVAGVALVIVARAADSASRG